MANCNNCGGVTRDGMYFCDDKCRDQHRIHFKPKRIGEKL